MSSGSTEQLIQPGSSFIGLQSYTEEQANSFFGRDSEIDNLTRLVRLNTLTIVFGKSGTGKTSLLNAGVFPLLRKNYCLPFRIRLEFNEKSPDLVTQIKNVLRKEIDTYGFKVDSYPSSETLWEYFHKESLWKVVTPILVFDQFEEIFTLAAKNPRFGKEELEKFWEELSDLVENSVPEKLRDTFLNNKEQINYNYKNQKAKIVFAFREEYLPEFETITTKIPSLKTSRFRLLPMNGHQALEVIIKTWKENIKPAEAKQIVSYLTNNPGEDIYELITVEPSLLSQVCAFIEKERIDEGLQTVSTDLLKHYPKESILRSIYEDTLAAGSMDFHSDPNSKKVYNPLKEFLEEKMITSEGFRTRYSLTGKDEPIQAGVGILIDKYFIRRENNAIELTHDVLAPIIKIDREKRRKETALAKERRKAIRKGLMLFGLSVLLAGGIWAISLIKRAKVKNDIKEYEFALSFKKDSLENEFLKKYPQESSLREVLRLRIQNASLQKQIDYYKKLLADSNRNEITIDSSILKEKDSLILQNEITINKLKREIIILNDTITVYKNRLSGNPPNGLIASQSIQISDLQDKLTNSQKLVEELSNENNTLNEENLKLRKELENLRKELHRKHLTIDSLLKVLNNVTLKGKIFYDQEGPDKPSNLSLYLIPKNENRKIVKKASVYEIFCNEKELNEAKGIKKSVTDVNGNYAFRNVPNGEYLLKICGYYGGFYSVSIKDADTKPIVNNYNASFPVKYPYTIEKTP